VVGMESLAGLLRRRLIDPQRRPLGYGLTGP